MIELRIMIKNGLWIRIRKGLRTRNMMGLRIRIRIEDQD